MIQTLHLVPSQLGHRVQKVHAISASELLLMFDDGDMRQIDLAPLMLPGTTLAGIAQDASLFSRVSIRGRTIEWPDGATLDPDVLYWTSRPVPQELVIS